MKKQKQMNNKYIRYIIYGIILLYIILLFYIVFLLVLLYYN